MHVERSFSSAPLGSFINLGYSFPTIGSAPTANLAAADGTPARWPPNQPLAPPGRFMALSESATRGLLYACSKMSVKLRRVLLSSPCGWEE